MERKHDGREALVALALLLGLLLISGGSKAEEDCGCRTPKPSVASRIVNGANVSAAQFPTVGQLGDTSWNFCTGTLIGSKHVLSAAHCVTDDRGRPNLDASQARFRLGGVDYQVAQIVVHPSYNGQIDVEGVIDLSILVLTEAVPNVTPSPLYRSAPTAGALLTLAGFGVTGTGETGVTDNSPNPASGTIDFGTTPIDEVTPTFVKWIFENKPAPNKEANTAPGDSGGPAFLNIGGALVLAGVTSGGSNDNAGYGDHSFDTRVDVAASWIDSIVGGGGGGGAPATPPAPSGTLSIASGPSATPNPAETFQNATFTCSPSDSSATVSWNFGDGTALSNGSSVSHAYAQAGSYVVAVTVTRGSESLSDSLVFQVTTPSARPLTISRGHFMLNFRAPFGSSLDLKMSNPAFAFYDRYSFYDQFDGKSVQMYLGGQQLDSLEVFGNRGFGHGSLNWNVRKGELSYKIRSSRVPDLLNAYGATNETVINKLINVPFLLNVDGSLYAGNYTFLYKARAGTNGTGR